MAGVMYLDKFRQMLLDLGQFSKAQVDEIIKACRAHAGGKASGESREVTRLASLTADGLREMADGMLLSLHRRLHQLWASGHTSEDVRRAHRTVAADMTRRNLAHYNRDDLDGAKVAADPKGFPYSGPGDENLPDNVKAMPEAERAHWVGAWNGAFAACQEAGREDCEGYAFRVANAAVAHLAAEWTVAYQNDLPDDAFLYIEADAEKDDTGKTTPRSKRHFPYRDASGKVDLPHLQNAVARIPQSNAPGLTAEAKAALQDKARGILEGERPAKADESDGEGITMHMAEDVVAKLRDVLGTMDTDRDAAGEALADLTLELDGEVKNVVALATISLAAGDVKQCRVLVLRAMRMMGQGAKGKMATAPKGKMVNRPKGKMMRQARRATEALSIAQGSRLFLDVAWNFGDIPDWIQVIPGPGKWKHPTYGDIDLAMADLREFKRNFDNGVYQEHIPVDAEHQTKESGAVGWYKELRLGGPKGEPGLWAKVEWTDRGTELLQDGRFKYFSPEWFDKWTDPANGKTYANVLCGGALTTRPFFKDKSLAPVLSTEGHLWRAKGEEWEEIPRAA